MLARLDEELAPSRSRVNREGTLLEVAGSDRPVAARVVSVVQEMGFVAMPEEGAPEVERWYSAAEVEELSEEEARVLAERWIVEMRSETIPSDLAEVELVGAMKSALMSMFRRAAETGVVTLNSEDLPDLQSPEGRFAAKWLTRRAGLEHP